MSARHNKAYTPGFQRWLDNYGGLSMPTVVPPVFDVMGDAEEAAIITPRLALFKNNWDKLSLIIGDSNDSKTLMTSKTEPTFTKTFVA